MAVPSMEPSPGTRLHGPGIVEFSVHLRAFGLRSYELHFCIEPVPNSPLVRIPAHPHLSKFGGFPQCSVRLAWHLGFRFVPWRGRVGQREVEFGESLGSSEDAAPFKPDPSEPVPHDVGT